MKFTDQQLKEIEDYSKLFFSPSDIALIIEVDEEQFLNEIAVKTSPAGKAFYTGKLLAEVILRKSIFDLAEAGSSPAQNLLLKIKQDSEILNLLNR
jgi:hypothetical protein